jgi:5-(carboxyamino)imidazole ribonucleotide mutase
MVDVQIVLGSESDLGHAKKCKEQLEQFGIGAEIAVASAHRNPEKLDALVKGSSAKVFIAMAGLSAALPGTVAAKTIKPVIGVPLNVKLEGLDALLSSMQMPTGVPVATVAIDGAKNAGILAAEIIALSDQRVAKKLADYKAGLAKK